MSIRRKWISHEKKYYFIAHALLKNKVGKMRLFLQTSSWLCFQAFIPSVHNLNIKATLETT